MDLPLANHTLSLCYQVHIQSLFMLLMVYVIERGKRDTGTDMIWSLLKKPKKSLEGLLKSTVYDKPGA